MNINKILNKIHYFILILVPAGWLLNWKYYFSRFQSEGFSSWLQIMIPIILVIFASVCFATGNYFKDKKNKIWILFFFIYGVLAFYSINCTTAGQYWDQVIKNQETETKENIKDNSIYLIERYKKKIEEKEAEYKKLNEIKDNSISDLSDLYGFKNTTQTVEEMKDKIEKDIKEYEDELEKILNENMISVKESEKEEKSKTLYQFYAGKNGNPDIIQFIFQVILSIIIELIAQISIYIFMMIEKDKKTIEEEKEIIKLESAASEKIKIEIEPETITPIEYWDLKITDSELRYFTLAAWEKIHRNREKYLSDKDFIFKRMTEYKELDFTENKYDLIIDLALENNLIKKENNKYIQENEFKDHEYFIKKMRELLKSD